MTERVTSNASNGDRPLEQELSDLRRDVQFPPTPDLALAVRSRLVVPPRPPRSWISTLFEGRPWLAAAAALLLIALPATIASSSVRHAIADVLGIPGIRIEFGDDGPAVPTSPAGANLGLGEQMSLDAAIAAVNFQFQIPDAAKYGEPDAVFVRRLSSGVTIVSLVYQPDDLFPETAATGTGALLMQFQSIERVEAMVKGVMGDDNLQQVSFGGGRGYWVEGTSSLTILDDPSVPPCCTEETRSSANVLLWQIGGVTYRLESSLSRQDALTVAGSMAPVQPERTSSEP